jgi:hypothetical protein
VAAPCCCCCCDEVVGRCILKKAGSCSTWLPLLAGAAADSLPPFEPLPTPKTKTHHPAAKDQNHTRKRRTKRCIPFQAIHPRFTTAGGGAITLSFTPSKKLRTNDISPTDTSLDDLFYLPLSCNFFKELGLMDLLLGVLNMFLPNS